MHIIERNRMGVRPTNASANGTYAIASISAMILFGVLSLLLSSLGAGRWGFVSALLMGICLDAVLWFSIIKEDKRCFALKMAFVVNWIGKAFPFALCFSIPLGQDYLYPWGEYIFESPLAAVFNNSLRSLAIALIFAVTKEFSRPQPYDVPLKSMLRVTSNRYGLFLVIAGCIKLTYWLSITDLDNPLFYFARVLNSTVMLVPFFVGYSAFLFKRATCFWLVILFFEVVVAFLTGTRGSAFYPIMYFSAGFILGLPTWNARLKWGFLMAPLAGVLLFSAVLIGAVRDVVGRTDLKTALTQGSIISEMSDSIVTSDIDMGGGIAYKAFRRLTNWGYYVVPSMSPDPVPYRGFDDFGLEIRSSVGLGIFALINPNWRGSIYFSNIHLNPYGFPVHIGPDGNRTSNVPMPVQVDGFTRGGWLAAFVYILFACAVIFYLERFFRRKLLPRYQPLFLMLLTFLSYIAVERFGSISLVHSMRQLVMEGVLVFFLYFTIDRILKKMGQIEKPPA